MSSAYITVNVNGIQQLGVYTVTVDADYVVPADASLVEWTVNTQSADRGIDFSLVPPGAKVQVRVFDSGGFSVNEIINGSFSLNDVAPNVANVTIQDSGNGPILSDGTAAQYNVGTSGTAIPLLDTANTWSANQRINAFLGIGVAPTFPFHVENNIIGGRVAYFKSLAAAFPNTAFVLDSSTGFNSGVVLQENGVDKFLLDYNSGTTSGSRLADTFELYSFTAGGPIIRVHESAPALSLAIDSSGNVTSVANIEATAPEASDLGFVLKSPDGTRWLIKVDNAGALSTMAAP